MSAMDWTEDDDLGLAEEDEFDVGDEVVLYTRVPYKRGEATEVELGLLAGFVPDGVVFRRTHKRVAVTSTDEDDELDWEFQELQRTVLTFVNWRVVDRIESRSELAQEHELGRFARLMDEVETTADVVGELDE